MKSVFVPLLVLACFASAVPASSLDSRPAQPLGWRHDASVPAAAGGQVKSLVSGPGADWYLVQLSRHEHDRLRLELRQRLHQPVNVGSLESLGLPGARLAIQERRLLRRQLRQQRSKVNEPAVDTADLVSGGEEPDAGPPRAEALAAPLPINEALVRALAPAND